MGKNPSETMEQKPWPKAGGHSGCPGATVRGGGVWGLSGFETKNDERLDI